MLEGNGGTPTRPMLRRLIAYASNIWSWVRKYFREHPRFRRLFMACGVLVGPPILLIIAVAISTPGKGALRNIKNQVASEVYSADSVLLGRFFIEDRTEVSYDGIAKCAVNSLLATEDIRFREHQGVDFVALGRVMVKSVFMRDQSSGGGSTLTQQLAKNLYPRKNFWVMSLLINKLREMIIAQRLESIYEKNELLTLYLNTVPFADQAFGIESASKRFFSKSAKDLNTVEAAVLIGMLKATHSYNPRLFPDRSKERRNVVLGQMSKYGFLSESERDSLSTLPLELNYDFTSHHEGLAPYFREYLKAELMTWCENNPKADGSLYNIYTDGLKIYTTIDSRLQTHAQAAVQKQMAELQEEFNVQFKNAAFWKGREYILEDAIHRSSRYQNLKSKGMEEADIIEELSKPILMRKFTYEDGEQLVEMSPIDSIQHHSQLLNAGFITIDPSSGAVKTWVGGINHNFYQYDHVKISTKRQVGSIFKPFVYATALEQGADPCELISAEREIYLDEEGRKYSPRNMQNDYEVDYTMRGALAYSVNTLAVKWIDRVGINNTIKMARRAGITSDMEEIPGIALGSSSISLYEMTTAFACIANNGKAVSPYYISSVFDSEGKIILKHSPKQDTVSVMRPETSELILQLLQTVVREGTAARIRWKYGVLNEMAGKTGTSQGNADGWYMGITPELVGGCWVGAEDARIRFLQSDIGQGANTALPIFAYFMKGVNADTTFADLSKARFERPGRETLEKLSCDLYELDSALRVKIERMIFVQDSLVQVDTLNRRDDTFLEKIFKRKLRLEQAAQLDTATLKLLKDIGG